MSGGADRDWERLLALERLWLDPDWDSVWGWRERGEALRRQPNLDEDQGKE